MLRVLTKEEELASRKENFQRLTPGILFDLAGNHYFIAVDKRENSVEVIELNSENITRIIQGNPCLQSVLKFDQMSCLNV